MLELWSKQAGELKLRPVVLRESSHKMLEDELPSLEASSFQPLVTFTLTRASTLRTCRTKLHQRLPSGGKDIQITCHWLHILAQCLNLGH